VSNNKLDLHGDTVYPFWGIVNGYSGGEAVPPKVDEWLDEEGVSDR
jgi:hypothetical protein